MSNVSHTNKDDAAGGKITPQNVEAERSLLGAIIQDSSIFPDILEKLSIQDFYDKRHALIYGAMKRLSDHNQQIDLLTVTSELRNQKILKDIGGAPYLADLSNTVPTVAHATAYADIVEQASIRSRLIRAGTNIVEGSYDG